MVGGIRDLVLFKEPKLILGFAAILVGALVCNLILTSMTGTSYFHLGFADQPVAHTDGLWNFLGMMLTGFACVLLGGCPLRQRRRQQRQRCDHLRSSCRRGILP